jgi:hypothetical protein
MNISSPPHLPFPRSYWVVPGKFLAGYYPGDTDPQKRGDKLRSLLQAGIRYVVNLMEEDETNREGDAFCSYPDRLIRYAEDMGVEVTCVRRPIADLSVPAPEEVRQILDEIDRVIEDGRPVFVHCWGGKGRTGTIVGCYLARHGIAKGEAVLELIHRLRTNDPELYHPSPETREQRDMVVNWKQGE